MTGGPAGVTPRPMADRIGPARGVHHDARWPVDHPQLAVRRGPGGGGGHGGWMGGLAPTPELLAKVEALRAANDDPASTWPPSPATTPLSACAASSGPTAGDWLAGLVLVVLDAVATLAGPVPHPPGHRPGRAEGRHRRRC